MRRRDRLAGEAVGSLWASRAGAAPATTGTASGKPGVPSVPPAGKPSAFAGRHEVVPLPFDPKKLAGLSEKLIVSHHDNNYAGAVKNLNKVEEQLGGLPRDAAPFVVAGLKERELTFSNSAILHEHYFANLGGSGRPGGAIEKRLAAAHGTFARWQEHFTSVGASLAGGSGWVVVVLAFATGEVHTYGAGNHTQMPAATAPLLVMDMYEHAYALDYGAAAATYIDAFFQNIKWEEVDRRLERAEKAAAAMRA
jgi:Fe-Mn family superoxide dismutase